MAKYISQIITFLIVLILNTSCKDQDKAVLRKSNEDKAAIITAATDTALLTGKNIRCILQDKTGKFWFATNGNGISCYDGISLKWYSVKDGLCSNYAWTIQEDKTGNLWIGTNNGVCRFDGKSFTNITGTYGLKTYGYSYGFETISGNLWFGANGGVNGYDGKSFIFFPIPEATGPFRLLPGPHPDNCNPYTVYSFLEDRAGNLWFGTEQKGVCRYDGKSLTWFREKGLTNGAIRTIFQDKTGNIWFGSNGGGVSRYDGKSLTNFSEEKGLSHHLEESRLEDESQKLNRVWSITEDKTGKIWFGTIDEGAWRYDGRFLTNFSIKDGLTNNAVWTIFKDKTDKLWFGTDGGGVCQFDGKSFIKFTGLNF